MTTIEFLDNGTPIAELERIPGNGWAWGWVSQNIRVSLTATFSSIDEAAKELKHG